MTSDEKKGTKISDAIFSGEIIEWFKFDMNISSRARSLHGDLGVSLWNNTCPEVIDSNVKECHTNIIVGQYI